MRMIAAVAVAVLTTPAFAQEPGKTGPEHEELKKLVGAWDFVMKMGDADAKGTTTYTSALGGMWVFSSMETELFGRKFSGHGMESYDAAKKKYVSIWADSMSGSPVVLEGTYDKAKKTMTMTGTGPGMDGAATKYRSVTVMPDADTIDFTMYMGDGKEPGFTVKYKRKK